MCLALPSLPILPQVCQFLLELQNQYSPKRSGGTVVVIQLHVCDLYILADVTTSTLFRLLFTVLRYNLSSILDFLRQLF